MINNSLPLEKLYPASSSRSSKNDVSIKQKNVISHFPKKMEIKIIDWCFRAIRKISIALPLSVLLIIAPNKAQSVTAVTPPVNVNVLKINSIKELPLHHPKDTIVFFDLDDTIFDSPHMLGSRAWRRYIVQETKHLSKNWHDIFTLLVIKKLPFVTVEKETFDVIDGLKLNGCLTSGLTARERQIWYTSPTKDVDKMTLSQLASVNIHFDHHLLKEKYPVISNDSEYYEGVFFANTDLKGDYLKKIIDSKDKPVKIVFIDDKLSQVESVAKILSELQIPHECYWYTATDEKVAKFNPLIANIQLYYFWFSDGEQVLSDLEAESIAKNNPELDANFYLQAVLKEDLNEL